MRKAIRVDQNWPKEKIPLALSWSLRVIGSVWIGLILLKLKIYCWNYCSKIIFKCVNSTVGPIFNEKIDKKWNLWVRKQYIRVLFTENWSNVAATVHVPYMNSSRKWEENAWKKKKRKKKKRKKEREKRSNWNAGNANPNTHLIFINRTDQTGRRWRALNLLSSSWYIFPSLKYGRSTASNHGKVVYRNMWMLWRLPQL